jgi:glycosyltransferase involved in cell wall biosynthesis
MPIPVNSRNVFVILPAYNEQAVIKPIIGALLAFDYQVVVIDDGSEPRLSPLLMNLPVHLLRHEVNLGQGAALQTGIEFALSKNAQWLVSFDADGQHDAADIVKLITPLQNDQADIVFGSRFMEGASGNMPVKRRSLLKIARWLNYLFTGLLLTDAHNGLRAFTNAAASGIRIRENGMAHATEILSRVKKQRLRYIEVPVNIRYTEYSRQKGQTIWSGFRVFFDLLLNKIFK